MPVPRIGNEAVAQEQIKLHLVAATEVDVYAVVIIHNKAFLIAGGGIILIHGFKEINIIIENHSKPGKVSDALHVLHDIRTVYVGESTQIYTRTLLVPITS